MDLILTKSISRFGRNMVDIVDNLRTLSALNPPVSGLYVNSWGRGKKQKIASRVGAKAPARFLCMAEENSVSEIAEVTHPKADPFQDFGLVVAAFNKTV